jgi:hypothetical protein
VFKSRAYGWKLTIPPAKEDGPNARDARDGQCAASACHSSDAGVVGGRGAAEPTAAWSDDLGEIDDSRQSDFRQRNEQRGFS